MSSQPTFDISAWTEATGSVKKGRLYGYGSGDDLKSLFNKSNIDDAAATTSSQRPIPTSDEIQSFALAAMQNPAFQALLDEKQKQTEDRLREEFQNIVRKMAKSSQLPNSSVSISTSNS